MYHEQRINEIQPLLDQSMILPSDAKDVARREWHRLTDRLKDIHSQIEALQSQADALDAQASAWAVILSAGGTDDVGDASPGSGSAASNEIRPAPSKQESVDAVVELLRQVGEPLHYKQIYERLTALGIEVKGKYPPNTLLARFFDDPRLERVRQGTYQIKPVEEVQQVD